MSLLSGQMNVLFDGFFSGPSSGQWGRSATGLGIDPNGLLVSSDGGPNSTGMVAYDPATGVGALIGSNLVGAVGFQSVELLFSDIAIDSEGRRWIVGDGAGSPIDGLFRDGGLEVDGTAFSAGRFSEIQIVPIPEPSTALLLSLGLTVLACRGRRPSCQ